MICIVTQNYRARMYMIYLKNFQNTINNYNHFVAISTLLLNKMIFRNCFDLYAVLKKWNSFRIFIKIQCFNEKTLCSDHIFVRIWKQETRKIANNQKCRKISAKNEKKRYRRYFSICECDIYSSVRAKTLKKVDSDDSYHWLFVYPLFSETQKTWWNLSSTELK